MIIYTVNFGGYHEEKQLPEGVICFRENDYEGSIVRNPDIQRSLRTATFPMKNACTLTIPLL
ncbi:MAG: hypothetical protein H7A37_10605 [Chlamydiales bacterium]|nr:hypothetical protein [Chlamydiia bacterium]MCP5508728.1 hypothetical protein [Chlamydiales bacterium]